MLGCTKSRHLRPWHSSNVAKQATKFTMNCVFLPSSQSQSFGKSFRKPSNTWTNPSLRQHTWLQATYPLYPDLLVESYIVTFDMMRHDSDMILHCFQFSVNVQSLKVFGSRNCEKNAKELPQVTVKDIGGSCCISVFLNCHRCSSPFCAFLSSPLLYRSSTTPLQSRHQDDVGQGDDVASQKVAAV